MSRAPLLFLSAGEVSGDQYGAQLALAIGELRPDARLVGWGGTHMAAAGVELTANLTGYSAVGVTEQIPAAIPVARALKEARKYLTRERPELVILIDYQGANMSLALAAKELGIPVVYYIAPQEWIWGFRGGLAKVARRVDLLLSIFEQEAVAYRAAGAQVCFVGHPLVDRIPDEGVRARLAMELALDLRRPTVGLFPGSRHQEIARLLPVLLDSASIIQQARPEVQFLLPVAAPHLESQIQDLLQGQSGSLNIHVIQAQPGMALMRLTDLVLTASGTATLEATLVGVPAVALYRVSLLTHLLARLLLRTPFVTLPNLVAGFEVIPELLQQQANPRRVAQEGLALLDDPRARTQMISAMAQVRVKLGEGGATHRAALEALRFARLLADPAESLACSSTAS